jgi:hypothetical protein
LWRVSRAIQFGPSAWLIAVGGAPIAFADDAQQRRNPSPFHNIPYANRGSARPPPLALLWALRAIRPLVHYRSRTDVP